MEIISIEGFVVNTLKYGENSKIINILTKDKGIIGVISKGCLKEKSKLRVISANFTYAIFHLKYKKDKLSTLIGADVIDYLINTKSDIEKIGYLSYLTELAKNVYMESPQTEVYNIFINAIKKIEEGFNPKIITNIVELKYLDYLGIGLNLNSCVECTRTSVVSLSHNKGGYVCGVHRTNEPIYEDATLKMIKAYYYVEIDKISELKIKPKIIDQIDSFLNIYYKEYTGLYLKSKKFLNNIKSS